MPGRSIGFLVSSVGGKGNFGEKMKKGVSAYFHAVMVIRVSCK
jgi:hypothetical protein